MNSQYSFLYLNYADGERIGENIAIIEHVYSAMNEQGLVAPVFYDGRIRSFEDMAAFMLRPGCIPVVVFDQSGNMAAFVWLNAFEGKTARGHFVFFKKFWGRRSSIPLGRSIFAYLLTLNDGKGYMFDTLVGITPESNVMAHRRSIECGAQYVGVIPDFCSRPDGGAEGGVIVVVTRETLFSASSKHEKKLGV